MANKTHEERAQEVQDRLAAARTKGAAKLRKVVETELKKAVGAKVSFTDDGELGNVDAYLWLIDAIEQKKAGASSKVGAKNYGIVAPTVDDVDESRALPDVGPSSWSTPALGEHES